MSPANLSRSRHQGGVRLVRSKAAANGCRLSLRGLSLQCALGEGAVVGAEEGELVLGFDAFGDDGETGLAADEEDAVEDEGAEVVGVAAGEEGAVELEAVDGQVVELAQGGQAAAEIVHVDGEAAVLQGADEIAEALFVGDEGGFGQFDAQQVGGEPRRHR